MTPPTRPQPPRSDALCKCGHDVHRHQSRRGRCMTVVDDHEDPFLPDAGPWKSCNCQTFDDSRLPDPGERLTFGVHRQPSENAETAEAWPSMPSWSARVRARTTRALRTLR